MSPRRLISTCNIAACIATSSPSSPGYYAPPLSTPLIHRRRHERSTPPPLPPSSMPSVFLDIKGGMPTVSQSYVCLAAVCCCYVSRVTCFVGVSVSEDEASAVAGSLEALAVYDYFAGTSISPTLKVNVSYPMNRVGRVFISLS